VRRAVFIDALGTMLWMAPPWEHLPAELAEGLDPERVKAAFIAEISYYMPRSGEGRDAASLADLRRRCAAVLSRELGREVSVEAMLAAIRFHAFEDAAPALRELRERGLRAVCVSNWDCSLPQVLERVGLAEQLDGVVTSAGTGARKPDPAIFAPALEIVGCPPEQALHVGDTGDDVEAARAAGIAALRIDRSGGGGADVIASLAEIVEHLD
jgi:HAD superfamily hydrolase (TIGR01549 family)